MFWTAVNCLLWCYASNSTWFKLRRVKICREWMTLWEMKIASVNKRFELFMVWFSEGKIAGVKKVWVSDGLRCQDSTVSYFNPKVSNWYVWYLIHIRTEQTSVYWAWSKFICWGQFNILQRTCSSERSSSW